MTSAAGRLGRVWQFRDMKPALLEVIAASTRVLDLEGGTEIVAEGDPGQDAYVVLSGRVEVSIAGKNGPLPVAVMGENELFGELAVLDPTGRRTATVVALTPVKVLRIDGRSLANAIAAEPLLRSGFEGPASRMAVARFIKSATVLGELPPETLAAISSRVRTRTVSAGDVIVRQGDPGSECFLVRSGELDVFDERGAEERQLATLRAGTLFGEAALLTGAPRNATVRARTLSHLLVLERADVVRAMTAPGTVATHLMALLQARSRPRRRAGVELHERTTADGDIIATLRDPVRHTYFRLSRDGAFLWRRLDGDHTIRDLTMDLLVEYNVLAPDIVMEIVRQLAASALIDLEHLDAGVAAEIGDRRGLAQAVKSTMEWSFSLEGCDGYFSIAYARGAKAVFTTAGAVAASGIAAVGFLAFIAMAQRSAGALLHAGTFARAGLALLPLMFLAVVLHEIGHGLAAKAAGAHVDRAGIGWYWFRPIVFVYTSDAWLANRRQRMHRRCGRHHREPRARRNRRRRRVRYARCDRCRGCVGVRALVVRRGVAQLESAARIRRLLPLDGLARSSEPAREESRMSRGRISGRAARSGAFAPASARALVRCRFGRIHRRHDGMAHVRVSLHDSGLGATRRSAERGRNRVPTPRRRHFRTRVLPAHRRRP